MTIGRAIHIAFYCFLVFFGAAQEADFQFYTTADGLSGSFTHGITQDRQGFIWVFNDYKLHRFDGHRFEQYRPPTELPGSGEGLRGGLIYSDSFLVTLGEEHLFLLNTFEGTWQSFPLPFGPGEDWHADPLPGKEKEVDRLVLRVSQEKSETSQVWFFEDNQFTLSSFPEKLLLHKSCFYESVEKIYCFSPFLLPGNDAPIVHFLSSTGKPPKQINVAPHLKDARIVDLCLQENKLLSILLTSPIMDKAARLTWHHEVVTIDPLTLEVEPHPANRFIDNHAYFLSSHLPLQDGSSWLCGPDRKLSFYDALQDTLFDFSPTLKTIMPNVNDMLFGFEDDCGTTWFCTRLGLLKVSLQASAFEHYFASSNEVCSGNCSFRGMTEDENGSMYAAFYHGIAQFNPHEGEAVFFTPNGQRWLPLPSSLLADQPGLWLNNGTLLDPKTGDVQAIPGSMPENYGEFGFFAKDREGRTWWTYLSELYTLNNSTGELQWEKVLTLLPGKENGYATNSLQIGKNTGLLYIDQLDRLLLFDPKTKKETWLSSTEMGVSFSSILAIEEGADSKIWLATDNGLVGYDVENRKVEHFTTDEGLPNNFVCGMLSEGDSCLWLSTNHGLSRFHIASQTFINFYEEDGLSHNEFNRKSYFKARDGRMYFGGLRGINAFYPSELMQGLEQQNASARVVLSSFEYVDEKQQQTLQQRDFQTQPVIHLYHHNRAFTFKYLLTDYQNPTEVLYSYQMEGYEEVWSTPSRFNFTRFSSLPAGEYVFRVKAKDNHGRWHPNELKVLVFIHPPWWQTWWAYGGYALLLAGIVFGILYFLRRRWRLQHELKQEQVEAARLRDLDHFKSRLYTNLTHEFRTPLTVILGMTGQIKNDPSKYLEEGTRLIETNGQSLLRLINQLLDLSKLENKSFQLKLQHGDIVPYLRYLTESFQTFANNQNLALRFFSTIEKLDMDFDPEQLKQVMTNLISNAVKFTPSGGEITVRLQEVEGQLNIKVQDTGIGIPQADLPLVFARFYQVDGSHTRAGEGTGIGLAHTMELLKLMGGDISADSEPGQGTTFTVVLPIKQTADVRFTNDEADAPQVEMMPSAFAPTDNFSSAKSPSPTTEAPSLLIIEDNPDVVVYLKSCLAELYQLDVAYNGKIGIEKALESIPDLIVSDVMMPEKDGYEVCDTLKNDERTSHIPIILLTAKADTTSKIFGLKRGADAYLTKPFDKEELLVRLEMLVERQQRMVAYFSKNLFSENTAALQETEDAILVEDAFMRKVRQIVEANYADEDFALPQLCQKMGMSRSQLFRKMKALSDTSPSDFIRFYRLNKAKALLETTDLTVSEVAWKVGYKNPNHFSKSFQEAFGILPSATSN